MAEFTMPILGADMEAGTLVAWCKQPGDRIERGEVIAEVETEKGLIEVEAFTPGVLEKILVAPGEKVPVGTVMAIIREEAATTVASAAPAAPAASAATAGVEGAIPAPGRPSADTSPARLAPALSHVERDRASAALPDGAPRVRASPAARRRAAALGVDLATIRGTGPDGAIALEDVDRAAKDVAAAPHGASRTDAMRQTIGAAMARSKREIPHYYLATQIDLHRTLTWLAARNAARPITERLLYGATLIKAVALALHEVPELNGVWTDEGAVTRADVHVGVAISLRGGGLVAPALHHTDRLGLDELMRGFRDLVARARAGSLRSSELSDPTITVTSLGEQGVETVFGIIYPPQVAIVGFGKVVERPWSVAGAVASRPIVTATLAADHRVSDGHRGGRFLAAVDRLLQDPERL